MSDDKALPTYYEPTESLPAGAADLLRQCVESGSHAVLLDESVIPADFFELSSGVAGEILHKLGTYRIPLACVVPDPSIHPPRFREFLREANRGEEYRFFATRDEATSWLESL